MRNDIQIIFVDIDWTIFDHSNSPSKFDIPSLKALKKAQKKGIKVFISTARPYHSVSQINFFDYFQPDGMILANGGLILYKDEVLYCSDIKVKDFEHIAKVALKHNINMEGIRKYDCFLIKEVDDRVLSLFATYPEDIPLVEDYHNQETLGICLYAPSEYDEIIQKELPKDFLYFRFHDYGVDIAPLPHDKGEAVKVVLDKLSISKDNAMAIGDDIVDISMFKQVKFGVAMANGKQETIDAATHVAKHVSKHGVKRILNKLIFRGF